MLPSSLIGWIATVAIAVTVLSGIQIIHLSAVLAWEEDRTRATRYFGLAVGKRNHFKQILRWHRRLLTPILAVMRRAAGFDFEKASFRYEHVAAPRKTCDEKSWAQALGYAPRDEDIFVVTQMKSGTTWMQYLVYEVLCRGTGTLVESGTALSAISPWLEARTTIAVGDAPLVGAEKPRRVIKTHLPVSLCPRSGRARYIYVVRHPVSCFASCLDFLTTGAGLLAPEPEVVEEWFCSEDMWWGPWPTHVAGWWRRGIDESRILVIQFEEMKQDLAAVARRVERLLGIDPLTEPELERVVHKCSFEQMKRHEDCFEMYPPQILAIDPKPFVKGSVDRYREVPMATRRRIERWCSNELVDSDFPLERFYPDVADT